MEILEDADKYKEENTKNSEKHLAHDWHIGFFFIFIYLAVFIVAHTIFFGTRWRGLWSVEAQ